MIWLSLSVACVALAAALVSLWRSAAVERQATTQRDAVLLALREVSRVVADDVQPALGTVREDAARETATAFYRAVARVEGTEPLQGR